MAALEKYLRLLIIHKKIIKAGTYKASNIKVAEAAKVIENSKNIAFVNELSVIFNRINITISLKCSFN